MITDNKNPQIIQNKEKNITQKKDENNNSIKEYNDTNINNNGNILQPTKEIGISGNNPGVANINKQNEIIPQNINNNSSSLSELYNLLNNKNLNSINNLNQNNSNILNLNNICYQFSSSINGNYNDNYNSKNKNDTIKNDKNNIGEFSPNNDDNAIYLIDSEEEKEINNNQNKINDNIIINNNQDNINIPILKNDSSNISYNNNLYINNNILLKNTENNSQKNKANNNLIIEENNAQNQNKIPQLNINVSNNESQNIIINNSNINNNQKDEKMNDSNKDNFPTKEMDKKLYYRRKINSYKRRYKGKEVLNLQIFIGNYGQKQLFPSFIFGSKQFFYSPRNYRHITPNSKGYIISFPGLKKLYNEKLIKKDLENMCTYYFKQKRGKQNSLDIKVKDEKTLNDGVFLNDGIVNFYLKIIEDEYTCGEGQINNVLIQKSYFYNSLSNQQNPDLSNNFCYPDSCSFIRTKINVFSFKTLIIPICEHYHWSLIIVNDIDKMKNIFSDKNLNEYFTNNYNLNEDDHTEYPEFFYLDSFYNINYRRMVIILKYLFYEYQKIYSIKCDMADYFMKNFRKIECYNPEVPKQNNSYDCGVFILIYAELFLYNPNYFLKIVSKKYKTNKGNELNNFSILDINNNNNNINSVPNNYIINNTNIINNINITNNANNTNIILKNIISPQNEMNMNFFNIEVTNNIINNENINSNNIIRNNINSLNINDNLIKNNNLNNDSNKVKNNEIVKKNDENKENLKNINNNNENINNIDSQINNDLGNSLDKIDIEIEENDNNNLIENNNIEGNINNTEINNEQNQNQATILNSEMKNEQNNEISLRNWFSLELVNNQRNKIKNLIYELSKIEKNITNKSDIEGIRKEQNSVIKQYMEKQKKEFDDYFSNLKE